MQESLRRLRDRNGAERANRLRPLGRLPSALRLARELQLRANRSSGSCFNVFRALRVTEEEAKHLAFHRAARTSPERLRNRAKSRTRARVEHPFYVLKRLWGFVKVRYRGLARSANRVFRALAMVNLHLAARRVPALVRP
jgi:IS5 family transposase